MRKPGISTLVACQNEESLLGLCVVSFLNISDEIIIVDNGSEDRSKEIGQELARRFPEKVHFYDAPHLKDVFENRQYALERSHYQWVVRADSDYVCYTDGPYDCRTLRAQVLASPRWTRPVVYDVFHPSVHGDLWHTGTDDAGSFPKEQEGALRPRSMHYLSMPMPRIYRVFPGFKFARLGRWEGAALAPVMRKVKWPNPIWMHCNIKSEHNYFCRSERTSWRELGDYKRFPTLNDYLRHVAPEKYGTKDLAVATRKYVDECVLPHLVEYEEEKVFPYPRILREAMKEKWGYRIRKTDTGWTRDYAGPPELDFLISLVTNSSG